MQIVKPIYAQSKKRQPSSHQADEQRPWWILYLLELASPLLCQAWHCIAMLGLALICIAVLCLDWLGMHCFAWGKLKHQIAWWLVALGYLWNGLKRPNILRGSLWACSFGIKALLGLWLLPWEPNTELWFWLCTGCAKIELWGFWFCRFEVTATCCGCE